MIRIRIINPDFDTLTESPTATWYTRVKSYEWEMNMKMDDDVKNCTVGHRIDSIELSDFYLSTKRSCDDLIEFLQKAKESLENE